MNRTRFGLSDGETSHAIGQTRVVTLIDKIDDSSGGAERFALALSMELAHKGFESTLCATRWIDEKYQARLTEANVRFVTLNRRAKWDVYRLWPLYRVLRSCRPDILHSHMFGSNFWGTLYGRLSRVPVLVAHEHTWSYSGNVMRRFLDGFFIGRLTDAFIAVSDQDAARMVAYERVPAERVVVLPTASVVSDANPELWQVRRVLGLAADAKIVTTAAMMRPQKALDVLINAIVHVIAYDPTVHLVLVGDGPCRRELERLAAELHVCDHVHFMGVRDNIPGLLKESNCSALSSDYEGMPLFVIESLTAGTPVVATDVGAIPQLLEHGKTGYVVPRRDPKLLADAILRILDPSADVEAMKERCQSVGKTYSIESISNQYVALYHRLIRTKGR